MNPIEENVTQTQSSNLSELRHLNSELRNLIKLFAHSSSMKFSRSLSRSAPLLTLLAAPVVVSVLGGCIFIKTPEPMPTPTPVPTPHGVQFDPKEGSPKGTPLNNQAGGTANPALPDSFRAALIVSGQELVLQSLKTLPAAGNKPAQVVLGAADTLNPVRLAGIITPTGSQTGAQETISVIQTWIAGQDLDVDIDPVFPTDTDNKRRVQIFFTARDEPYKGQRMSLNRMLVRSGYAVVDLYSPTSFDQNQWLYDETFARQNTLGLWKTDTFRQLQQRVKLPSKGTGAKSSVNVQTNVAPALVAPGAPGAPGSPGSPATTPNSSPAMPSSPAPAASPVSSGG